MGGNAFPIPAQRLSTSHLNALFAYAQARLATIFSGGEIKMPRYAINKGSHGDLDILCPCDWAGVGMKGQESGLVDYASEIPPGGDTESAVEKLTTGIGLPTDPAKLNAFCDRVARALGAVKWIRGGYEISTAVPCHLVPGAETDLPPSNDVYYQVDVLMIPTSQLQFTVISISYSSTILLLATALRIISKSLTIHMTHLTLRHSPFFGLPAIDIFLTSDPEAFYKWVGLDLDRWNKEWMKTEEDAWRWLTEVEDGSIVGQAWKRLATPSDRVKQDKRRGKVGDLDRFVKWLRSPESKWFDQDKDTETKPVTPATSAITQNELASSTSTVSTVSSDVMIPNPNLIDPEKPNELDPRAVDALNYWGRMEEYGEALEVRSVSAALMWSSQRRKVQDGSQRSVRSEEKEVDDKEGEKEVDGGKVVEGGQVVEAKDEGKPEPKQGEKQEAEGKQEEAITFNTLAASENRAEQEN